MLIFFKSWRESFWLCLTLGSCKLRNYIPSLQAQRRQISNRLSNWPPPPNLVSNFIGSIMGGKKYWPIFKLVGKQKGQKHSEMTAPFLCMCQVHYTHIYTCRQWMTPTATAVFVIVRVWPQSLQGLSSNSSSVCLSAHYLFPLHFRPLYL